MRSSFGFLYLRLIFILLFFPFPSLPTFSTFSQPFSILPPERRTCHTAVRSAAGWVIPVDTLIETGQINVRNRNTYLAMGVSAALSFLLSVLMSVPVNVFPSSSVFFSLVHLFLIAPMSVFRFRYFSYSFHQSNHPHFQDHLHTTTTLLTNHPPSPAFYFSKSCAPGILDQYYNPFNTNPVSMCEACSTAGPRRCLRSDSELYYGSSGAFRCLVESEWCGL